MSVPDKYKTDIMLSMARGKKHENYMQMIVDRTKNHEFRKYRFAPTTERFWFYESLPVQAVTYICEIGPVVTRPPKGSVKEGGMDAPLAADGDGNREYCEYHPDWEGYDFAYPILSCYKLKKPITLKMLREDYGANAPRGYFFVHPEMHVALPWKEQELVWTAKA